MTFRLDVRWRRLAVRSLDLQPGALVADLASGTGDLCVELAPPRAAAGVRSTSRSGCCWPTAAGRRGSRPTSSSSRCPDGMLDGVTCGFALRNLVELGAFFDELDGCVRPGGRIALLDVATPPNAVIRWGHGVYFGKVVPRIGGLLSDPAAYRYLPKSVAYLPPPVEMLERLRAAGFTTVQRRLLSGGITQLVTATRSEPMGMRAVTRPLDREVDLNGFARGDGFLFVRDGIGVAGRGRGRAGPRGRGGGAWPASSATTRSAARDAGPSPWASSRSDRRPGPSSSSRPSRSARVRTATAGSPPSTAPTPTWILHPHRPPARACSPSCPGCRSTPIWPRSRPVATR